MIPSPSHQILRPHLGAPDEWTSWSSCHPAGRARRPWRRLQRWNAAGDADLWLDMDGYHGCHGCHGPREIRHICRTSTNVYLNVYIVIHTLAYDFLWKVPMCLDCIDYVCLKWPWNLRIRHVRVYLCRCFMSVYERLCLGICSINHLIV